MSRLISSIQAAALFGVTHQVISRKCSAGRIKGAYKVGRNWVLPSNFKIAQGKRGPKSYNVPAKRIIPKESA